MDKKWSVPVSVLVSQTSFHGGTSGDYYQEIMTLNVNENNAKKPVLLLIKSLFVTLSSVCPCH